MLARRRAAGARRRRHRRRAADAPAGRRGPPRARIGSSIRVLRLCDRQPRIRRLATCIRGRRFNDAVDDYCALLGLPAGLIETSADGTNAFLVALERDRGVLVSEAEIVDAKQPEPHLRRLSDRSGPVRGRPSGAGEALERAVRQMARGRSRAMPLNRVFASGSQRPISSSTRRAPSTRACSPRT